MVENTNYLDLNNKFFNKLFNIFNSIRSDKLFMYSLIAISFKTLLFFLILSGDMASDIKWSNIFFSAPPILTYLSFFLIFLSFSYLFKNKGHLWSFSILNILATILYIGDLWYYRSNRKLLNYHLLSLSSNLDNLGESIIGLARGVDLLFIIDLIIIIVLTIKESKLCKTYKRSFMNFIALIIIPVVYLTYAHIKVDKLKKCYPNQTLFQTAWTDNQVVTNLTPIGYHIYDLSVFYEQSKPHTLTNSEKIEADNWFKNKKENLPDNKYKGMFEGKNLIVLQVESLENSMINRKVNNKEITPNMNKLLSNSIYFDNFHEQTYVGNTSDAELIANTSVFPIRDGSTFFRYPLNKYKYSLPNIFKNMGYSTTASHPDKGSYWNWLQSLKSIGYDNAYDETAFDNSELIGLGLSDESFLKQWADIIENSPEPFVNFGITLSCHTPFKLSDEYIDFELPTDLQNTDLGNYIQALHYADKQIGMLIDLLDNKGILDNTVIILYGDHEGVNKYFADSISNLNYDNNWFKDNNKEVPLIIYSKGMKGEVNHILGGQVDILPTVAYLFDKNSANYSVNYIGRNLLNTKKDFVVLSDGTIIANNLDDNEISEMINSLTLSNKLVKANYYKEGIDENEK